MTKNSFRQADLAERWGISERTLERWRTTGYGPRYHKMGGRVVYLVQDVEAYEARTAMRSTSEPIQRLQAGGQR